MPRPTPPLPQLFIRMQRDPDGTPSWIVYRVVNRTSQLRGIRVLMPMLVRDTLPEAHTAATHLAAF